MSTPRVKMVVLSTDDLDESIAFYVDVLGFPLRFRDGDRFAALDGGGVTIGLAVAEDHPIPGEVVVGIGAQDVDGIARAVESAGGLVLAPPHDDAHERRAIARDGCGNGIVIYGQRSTESAP